MSSARPRVMTPVRHPFRAATVRERSLSGMEIRTDE
jgi:hypothetical protein